MINEVAQPQAIKQGLYTASDGNGITSLWPITHQVKAVSYGDEALNLTLIDVLPDGTETTLFTTLQYFGYKPASNLAWVTVEPQTSDVLVPTKTPEELQQEAEQAGWLDIWHEFTWWWSWYRIHIKVNINPTIHVGFRCRS